MKMSKLVKDLTGKVFGRLIVLEYAGTVKGGATWLCLCKCGEKKIASSKSIQCGDTRSCGCLQDESNRLNPITHGGTVGGKPTEYLIWKAMRSRCRNPKHKDFHSYGGRGITVCKRWENYAHFLADMGRRPSPELTIERVDTNKGYCKSNCKWGTWTEQNNNKRVHHWITHNGVTLNLTQWSNRCGINPATLRNRIYRGGWSFSRAITQPLCFQ